MISNFLKISLRNIWKHKVFSLINISGLAIGISAALVIYLIVDHDLGFDKFQPGRDRIYRIVSHLNFPGQLIKNQGVPSPLPLAIKKDITGIENVSGFQRYNNDIKVKVPVNGSESFKEFKKQNDIIFADEQYFDLIPYEWVSGNPEVLKEPNICVLTLSKVNLYFPNMDPSSVIGKTLVYDDSVNMTVKGIVKDINASTDFNFTAFLSYITIPGSNLKENYGWDEWNSVSSSSQAIYQAGSGWYPFQRWRKNYWGYRKHMLKRRIWMLPTNYSHCLISISTRITGPSANTQPINLPLQDYPWWHYSFLYSPASISLT